MGSIFELNALLKRSRFDLLKFNIESRYNNEIMITEFKASLNLDDNNNNKKFETSSRWFPDVDDAKVECANRMLEKLQLDAKSDPNKPVEKQPIIHRKTLLLLSVFLNVVLLVTFLPITLYILFPFLLATFWLLTVPFFLNQDCRILQCTGNRVIARSSISYDEYKLPIKYLYTTDYTIDIGNGVVPQDNNDTSFIAIAKKDIYLDLVQNYDSKSEDSRYRIVIGCGFRVNVINGVNTAIVRIIKKDGKVLTYQSLNIGDNEDDTVFHQQYLPQLKVRSKHGTHFMAEKYSKRLDLTFIERYQIITLIYLDWIVSFFYF